jgi:hypothetical protein
MKKLTVFFLIILIGPIIGGVYGIIHDQLTFTISPEYYTKFKFYQFEILDDGMKAGTLPNQRAAVAMVGFLASWWMGIPIGIILGLVGFLHHDSKRMFTVTLKAFLVTIVVAFITGIIGLIYGKLVLSDSLPENLSGYCIPEGLTDFKSFISVGSMHNFSYIGGLTGLIAGIIYSIKMRKKTPVPPDVST